MARVQLDSWEIIIKGPMSDVRLVGGLKYRIHRRGKILCRNLQIGIEPIRYIEMIKSV